MDKQETVILMYSTSERINRLKANRDKIARTENVLLIDQAYTEAAEEYADRPVCVQFAHGFRKALERRTLVIQDEDILAGFLFRYTYNVNFPMRVGTEFDSIGRLPLNMDVRREFREIVETQDLSPDEEAEMDEFTFGADTGLIKHWHSGHVLPSYASLFEKGWSGLSAYFTSLSETTQNEIIDRTENE